MTRDLLTVFALVVAGIVAYRYRIALVTALRRFDARNVQRIHDQERQKTDPVAHFKETLSVASEQVEDVSEFVAIDERLGGQVIRYVFDGQHFATRQEAENARAEKIRAIARGYYQDLPVALAERRSDKLN